MRVAVVLFGQCARLLPEGSERGSAVLEAKENATVRDILDGLGVPEEDRRYVSVDGARIDLSRQLWDGAEVRVIVPLGGG